MPTDAQKLGDLLWAGKDGAFRNPYSGADNPAQAYPAPPPLSLRDFMEMASMTQMPGVSDAASGGLALSDLMRGDFGSAGLNGIGILPLVPAMGGMMKIKSGFPSKTLDALSVADRIDHPDLKYLTPVARSATLSDDVSATVRKTSDGNYLGIFSPTWGSGQKPFHAVSDNVDELVSAMKQRISNADAASAKARIYEAVPSHWTGDAKKIARGLIDAGYDLSPSAFISSARSESKYIKLPNGEKIRVSSHNLPGAYEAADYEFLGGDVAAFLKSITGADK